MNNGKSPLMQKPDYLVCTCFGVMYSEVCTAIEKGCHTFDALQDALMVGTGCTSCVSEVNEILAQERNK